MKRIQITLLLLLIGNGLMAQIDEYSVMGLPTDDNDGLSVTPAVGSIFYNTATDATYQYTSSGWEIMGQQNAQEVPLVTPVDVDQAGESSITNESNLEEVVQAMAPITSNAARVLYPPSIVIDASSNVTGATINLYSEYTSQFATPAVSSSGAPSIIPTYTANELYYYVTYFDTSVFANISIDGSGVMTYDIIGQPADYNSLINVVFVVK